MLDQQGNDLQSHYLLALARQEIEYLRRLYAAATDALGRLEDKDAQDYGHQTYHRIFTPDAQIRDRFRHTL